MKKMTRYWMLLLPVLALGALCAGLDAQCCGKKDTALTAAKVVDAKGSAPIGTLNSAALAALRKAKVPMTLIDARPDAKERIPGALVCHGGKVDAKDGSSCSTACAEKLGPKDRLIVTYCAGPKCNLSSKLARRLRAAGYRNVIEYREGYEGWKKMAAACSSCPSQAQPEDGVCPATGKTGGSCTGGGDTGSCPASGPLPAKAAEVVARIDTAGLKALLDAKVPVVLVDARTGKYDDGVRIPGARAIKDCSGSCWSRPATYQHIVKSKGALVVTYCAAPQCPLGSTVARKLRAAGYLNVIEYKEGITAWKKAGLRTIKKAAECCGSCEKSGSCSGGDCSKKTPGSQCSGQAPARSGCCSKTGKK